MSDDTPKKGELSRGVYRRGITDKDMDIELDRDLHLRRGSDGYGPTMRGDPGKWDVSPEETGKIFFYWDKDPRLLRKVNQRPPNMNVIVLENQDKKTGEWRVNLAEARRDPTRQEMALVFQRLKEMNFKISEKHSYQGADMGKGGYGTKPGPLGRKSPTRRGYSLTGLNAVIAVISGLLEAYDYLEFPEYIDSIKAVGIDPVTVNRAIEKNRFGLIKANLGDFYKVYISELGMLTSTNILLHEKTGSLFLVALESTADVQQGDFVPYGRAFPVGRDVIHKTSIFKDYERGDVFYKSPDDGRWIMNGKSTGNADFLRRW